jgi:hypothetical protein
VFFSTLAIRNGSKSTFCPWLSAPITRAIANNTMAKATSSPSTMLKELKNWVSDDGPLDTITRWYQWEKSAEEPQYSGSRQITE